MQKKLIISFLLLLSLTLVSCSNNPNSSRVEDNTTKTETNIKEKEDVKPPSKETSSSPHKEVSESTLSNKEIHWGYRPNKENKTPEIVASVNQLLGKYSGYYVGDTSSKKLYLTFDEGYENGYTGQILDILKKNKVPAAFFVTKPYIEKEPELIKRMVNEGHIVGNHTSTHPAMPSVTDNTDKFNSEFSDTEKSFKDLTGKDMPKFFRPPMGRYSEKSLYLTQKLGYKSVFWSFAHKDWEVNNQPSVENSRTKIVSSMHNGCILLLHAVSESNTNALDSVIKDLQSQGYEFLSLDKLP
ncbi:MAG: delta-lactam-biosynthetic de-N-acetylase [Clostridium sp.]|uniref:delta-lactam-biosynthetic de-N-acetylase n=1 Tax=Clostridium sp. TaxID=1506 RepID=UPI002FC95993